VENARKTPPTRTLHELLTLMLPSLMAQYDKEPWDYKIFGPASLDDYASLNIYLDIGTDYRKRTVVVKFSLSPFRAEIIGTQIGKKPKKAKVFSTKEIPDAT
jgi:hypothetical protein